MAIIKHLSSKNADYGRALEYLMFQHNEETQKPILDAKGNRILREEYYMDRINCNPFSIDKDCERVNSHFHKNQKRGEIKSHHYIISFEDVTESALTGEKAQALGLEYARRNFPGHQALVCTHMDGHNESGNIHCHIVINSVRKYDVEKKEFMERRCDGLAGYNHHPTDKFMKYLKRNLMEMCVREGLHQIDLLSPAPVKITEKEYWKTQREQDKWDKLKKQIIADGLTPRETVFLTQKQYLRDAITEIPAYARSEQEFQNALKEKFKITLKINRSRYSYLHPERGRYITGRSLGTDFEKDTLLARFSENEKHGIKEEMIQTQKSEISKTADPIIPVPTPSAQPEYDPAYDYESDPLAILFIRSDLHLVTDLQNNIKAQQSAAYAQKVKITNLKEMAKTVCYIQENNYDTRDDLSAAYRGISEKFTTARKALRATEDEIKELNEQIHYVGRYMSNKKVYQEFLKVRNKKKFWGGLHYTELALYEAGVKYIKENLDSTVPSLKGLKAKRDKLLIMKDAQYDTYHYFKEYQKELHTVCSNVDAILGKEHTRTKEKEKSVDIF